MEKQLAIIENLIYEIRGHKVMLDSDLAELYNIQTFRLNEAVKRNIERFPSDFMFQLTNDEWNNLISQIAISSLDKTWGGRRTAPYAFTEHGVLMLSSVLNSKKAIEVNIAIMRAFIKLRQLALKTTSKIDEIKELKTILLLHIDNTDKRFAEHSKKINQIIEALNNLTEEPIKPKRPTGFKIDR